MYHGNLKNSQFWVVFNSLLLHNLAYFKALKSLII